MPYKIYSADNPLIQRLNPKPFRLNQPRYCPQDITGFYTIDANINPLQDLVNYCPQDINIYENIVSGSPTVPSIMTTDTALWLDANDASTITLESGAVSEWRDKSGNNRHATQTTAGNRPLLVTDGLNGTDVIRFDGSNDFLSLAFPLLNTGIRSLFIVAKKRLTSSLFMPLSNNASTFDFSFVPWNDGLIYAAGSGYFVDTQGGSFNTPYLSSEVFNNSSVNLWLNGTELSNLTSTNVSNQSIFNEVGRRLTSNQYSDGDISQIVFFPRVLNQAERELVEGYLAWSTGLQDNLPIGHPYKDSYTGVTVTPVLTGDFYTIDTYPNLELGVSVSPTSVLENSGTPFVFTFTLSSSIPYDTVITYSLSGTATEGTDYPNQTGTVTILANQTTTTVNITPTDDALTEGDETITLTILNAIADSQFVALNPASATATITEEIISAVVNVGVSPSSVNENAGIPLVFTFSVNNPPAPINSDCTINFTIIGTATAGVDYPSGQPTSIVIPAGQSSATLSITPIGDSLVESNETITVSMQSASATGYSFYFGNSSATGTITNDD